MIVVVEMVPDFNFFLFVWGGGSWSYIPKPYTGTSTLRRDDMKR